MGVFAVALAIVGALSIAQAYGLQSMIIGEPDLTERVAVSAFTGNAIIFVFLSILIAGVAFLGGRFLGDDSVRRVLLVLALSPIVRGFCPPRNSNGRDGSSLFRSSTWSRVWSFRVK